MTQTGHRPMTFRTFFRTVYRDDHCHPANLALHILGVIAGLALIAAGLTVWPWWVMFGFPVVHLLPGLIGHRLFDRNAAVGDLRLMRGDHPLWWFFLANHLMAAQILTFRW